MTEQSKGRHNEIERIRVAKLNTCFEELRTMLMQCGFPETAVRTKIQMVEATIAFLELYILHHGLYERE